MAEEDWMNADKDIGTGKFKDEDKPEDKKVVKVRVIMC